MRARIIENLASRFAAYEELMIGLDGQALVERIDAPKHKSLGEHIWCIIGARESYAGALKAGEWQGFSCSMTAYEHADFTAKLTESAREVLGTINAIDDWTPQREELLATLAEHEVMHEGQIIRHAYGMGRLLPGSWKWA